MKCSGRPTPALSKREQRHFDNGDYEFYSLSAYSGNLSCGLLWSCQELQHLVFEWRQFHQKTISQAEDSEKPGYVSLDGIECCLCFAMQCCVLSSSQGLESLGGFAVEL